MRIEPLARVGRRVLPRESSAGDTLRRWRHRIELPAPDQPFELVVDAFGAAMPRATFVQVGSNDGVRWDPICRQVRTRPWSGVMIEPVPFLFERLRSHYGGTRRLHLENLAIAPEAGHRPLYHLPETLDVEKRLPGWYDALGSFDRDVVLSHRDAIPDIEDRIEVLDVPCLPFDAVCERNGLDHVDLIHVDTEGYDYEVLKLVDFDRWRPAVVLYEHLHLSPDDRLACQAELAGRGYVHLVDAMDTLCVHRSALRAHPSIERAFTAADARLAESA